MSNELPDLFRFNSGQRVETPADWSRRRTELRQAVLDLEYGQLPPTPNQIRSVELHSHKLKRLQDARHSQYHLLVDGPQPGRTYRFLLDLIVPSGGGPFPVVLNGDGCWRYVNDEITADTVSRGYALAKFSRVEIVPDNYRSERDTGLYLVHPEGDYGALAAWAWGYHRCVDFLLTQPDLNPAQIAICGHSRGGKTVLLAGATDERIALTAPNDSGCGGAGCFRFTGPGSEKLENILGPVAYWFSPKLKAYIGRDETLPFDQHFLKALVAPRAYLSTEALGDLWANPRGTWLTHQAAREAYRFLKAEDRMAIWYREGEHAHGQEDWTTFLDFADWQFKGVKPTRQFNQNPFPDLAPLHSWTAPGC